LSISSIHSNMKICILLSIYFLLIYIVVIGSSSRSNENYKIISQASSCIKQLNKKIDNIHNITENNLDFEDFTILIKIKLLEFRETLSNCTKTMKELKETFNIHTNEPTISFLETTDSFYNIIQEIPEMINKLKLFLEKLNLIERKLQIRLKHNEF
jgi:uncharacterized protein Yka (UPF0111/DUF47 family)